MNVTLPDPASTRRPAAAPYLRIATEEAFAPPEMLDIYRRSSRAARSIRAFAA